MKFKTTIPDIGGDGVTAIFVDFDYEPAQRQTRSAPGIDAKISLNEIVDDCGNDVDLTDQEEARLLDEMWEHLASERAADYDPPEPRQSADDDEHAQRVYESNLCREPGERIQ